MEQSAPSKRSFLTRSSVFISMSIAELVSSLVLLAVLVTYGWQAHLLPKPFNQADIGAGGFPMLVAIATGAGLLVLAVGACRRLLTRHDESKVVISRVAWVVIAAGLLFAQAYFLERIGVYVCVALFSAAIMLVAGERRPAHLVGVPLALTAFVYVVFSLALSVNFP